MFFIITFLTIFYEWYFFFQNNIFLFLVKKFIVFVIIFFLSFFLFIFKIIGGADGKVFIIIFLNHSLIHLNFFYIYLFYLLFSFGFFLEHLIQLLINKLSGCEIFFELIIKEIPNKSILKKVYIKAFYTFGYIKNIGEIHQNKVNLVLDSFFYNSKKRKIQFLIHKRTPLILLITIVYITMYILSGF